jgi:2-desacetyl-2-hydroxyethyl bacteriochlorophyllide A dehydrogenase
MSKDHNTAIWLIAPGQIELRKELITQPGKGEVLVKTKRTLISTGTEMSLYSGTDAGKESSWSQFAKLPRKMGYSHAGIIDTIGPEVDPQYLGKRVATRGQHAAYVIRKIEDLKFIPDNVSFEDACFSTLAAVAMNGIRRSRLQWGEKVAVCGLGIVGHLSTRLALLAGASEVIACDIVPTKMRSLEKYNSVKLISVDSTKRLALQMLANEKNNNPDLVIECSGNANLITQEIECLGERGRLLLLSSPRESVSFHFHDYCNRPSIEIIGAHGFSQPKISTIDNPWTHHRHASYFLQSISSSRIAVNEMITHRFDYHNARDAYALLSTQGNDTLAVILKWD